MSTTDEKPTYWSIDADQFEMWTNLLGATAAGKLMQACAAYFFGGIEPTNLNRQAQTLFEGERNRLERRRASATNGRKGGRTTKGASVDNHVENSGSAPKVAKKSRRSSAKVAKKLSENQTPTTTPSREINKSRLTPILSLNLNQNPQTPAPSDGGAGSGGRGAGSVSPAEFAAMLGAGLGYDAPAAYGAMSARVAVS